MTASVPVDWVVSLSIGGALLVATGLLFAFDMMGGGDVKLLSTTAVWAGPEHIALFIVTTAIIGGMVSVARMVWVVLARAGMEISAVPLARIPYGVAIAGGGMFVAAQLLMG
jgi:prepilin peptidase CpaA